MSDAKRNSRKQEFGAAAGCAAMAEALIPIVEATAMTTDEDFFYAKPNGGGPSSHRGSVRSEKGSNNAGISHRKSSVKTSSEQTPKMKKRATPPTLTPNTKQRSFDGGVIGWPEGLKQEVIGSFSSKPNVAAAKAYLQSLAWPTGLQETLLKSVSKIGMRFIVVDDSGSMSQNDGRRIVSSSGSALENDATVKVISCTRWSELVQTLHFAAKLANEGKIPTEFRLLNGADPCIVGLGDDGNDGYNFAEDCFTQEPAGQTPLCEHIRCVIDCVEQVADELRKNGLKAAIIICTDGEATDGNISEVLQRLKKLPAWLVIRLCTNEQRLVDYWNGIDKELEIEVDVLDDLVSDAREVQAVNDWLVYGEPLHRMREFGAAAKEFDLVDETALGSEQMKALISHVYFGDDSRSFTQHPDVDWKDFLHVVEAKARANPKTFCTLRNKFVPFIDTKKLARCYATSKKAGQGVRGGSAACGIC